MHRFHPDQIDAIADAVIYADCERAAKAAIITSLWNEVGKRRRPRRPNWTARDRMLAPYEKRFQKALRDIWDDELRIVLANMKRHPLKAYARKDKDIVDSWLYPSAGFAKKISREAQKTLTALLETSIMRIIDTYGLDVSFDVVNDRALDWLMSYTPILSANLEDVNLGDLRGALLDGIEAGEGMDKLRTRVHDIFDSYDRHRAEMIARTEAIRAQEQGNQTVYKEAGFERKVWIANPGCCELCAELDNQDVPIDEPFFDDDYGDGMAPPAHPNCVLPGTLCVAPGGIVAGYRSRYQGQAIELTFANGTSLSVTPNHMLLTPHGFAAANLLHEGDDVFYCPEFQGKGTVHPNNDGKPTLIEEIVETLAKTRGMAVRCVPLAPEYLHGDGRFCDSDIDVIWPDGLLEGGLNPIMLKPLGANYLGAADPKAASLSGFSPLALLLHRMATTAGGDMGGFRQSHPFFRRRLGHAKDHRFMSSPGDNTALHEAAANAIAVNPESTGEGFLRDSGQIQLTDQVVRQIDAPRAEGNPGVDQSPADGFLADIKLPSQGHDGKPGLIETTKIIHVEVFLYYGHVYDLQTYTSLYICNGILSSNCRCSSGPWDPSWGA